MTDFINKLMEILSRIETLKHRDTTTLKDIKDRLESIVKGAKLDNGYVFKINDIKFKTYFAQDQEHSNNIWNADKQALKNLATLILEEISESKPLEKDIPNGNYVNLSRIEEIKLIKSEEFDYTKLIAFLEGINIAYQYNSLITIPLLIRAITDHIPPVLSKTNFADVCGSYGGSSFKAMMAKLQESNRKIADMFLHTPIRNKETLPNETQVNFKHNLDVLLEEIVRINK